MVIVAAVGGDLGLMQRDQMTKRFATGRAKQLNAVLTESRCAALRKDLARDGIRSAPNLFVLPSKSGTSAFHDYLQHVGSDSIAFPLRNETARERRGCPRGDHFQDHRELWLAKALLFSTKYFGGQLRGRGASATSATVDVRAMVDDVMQCYNVPAEAGRRYKFEGTPAPWAFFLMHKFFDCLAPSEEPVRVVCLEREPVSWLTSYANQYGLLDASGRSIDLCGYADMLAKASSADLRRNPQSFELHSHVHACDYATNQLGGEQVFKTSIDSLHMNHVERQRLLEWLFGGVSAIDAGAARSVHGLEHSSTSVALPKFNPHDRAGQLAYSATCHPPLAKWYEAVGKLSKNIKKL
jgi:hypothetical protein